MFQKALRLIKKYDKIIIHRHSNPDGDAIGSQVGLRELIKANFPDKKTYIVGDGTKRYAFMDGWQPDVIDDAEYKGALAIILDTSVRSMISDDRYTLADATLRFDHHIYCETIADVDIVNSDYESCCGLITDFAIRCKLDFNDAAAKALFTGMVTDSGRFRYDSVNARTFLLASKLREYDFDTNKLYADLYADDFETIKLRASYTLKVKFTENNVAYIVTTKEELAKSNVDAFTVSRGMVGVMSDIKGVDIWVNFTETDNGVLCELRSKKYNINPVAVKYGGGGHSKASGATVENLDVAYKMLNELNELR
ncbi:MAG: bifunctional oligoribonuclease/PAP phosphatase NrnA [Corallococcus sp.]|nr:bifunctional oligoribonuclease/PAP phosphatase NrnA [Corallococcus sp.]